MLSFTEENYLKAVLKVSLQSEAGTNKVAHILNVKPATATDMLKKLKEKKLVDFERYGKISLTQTGRSKAVEIIRKHRLWETFLSTKLGFSWDEVHEVAEQLEHIQSSKLIDRLDEFLGFPAFDPHGDVIPKANGDFELQQQVSLSDVNVGTTCDISGVKDSSPAFLKYVSQLGLKISDRITVVSRQDFDGSMEIRVSEKSVAISEKFANNLLVVTC